MGERRTALRIHFEADDLARVRVLDGPDPLWETLLSLHVLQDSVGRLVFGEWRSWLRQRLDRSVDMLFRLAPPRGYSVDFLTPGAVHADLDTVLDDVLSTPRAVLEHDLGILAANRPVPTWTSALASGEVEVVQQLGQAIRQYYSVALQPFWPVISGQIRADRLHRGQVVLDGGVESLLATLHPTARWQSPVLEIDYPVDMDLRLDGRGLVLVPSLFCWQKPITLHDNARQPVLVYPIDTQPGWFIGRTQTRSVSELIGRTRAAVLDTICAKPLSTTAEIAAELRISQAGASQHATVLRHSGLIATDRRGGSAHHRPTSFGSALLALSTVDSQRRRTADPLGNGIGGHAQRGISNA